MLLHVCTSCFVRSKIVSTAVAMYAFGSTSEPVVQCIFTARMCTAVHSIILSVHPCILPSRSSHNCGPICAVTSFIPLCPHMPAAGGRHARSRSRPVAVAGADIRSALARGATARPSTTTLSPSQQAALFELPLASWKPSRVRGKRFRLHLVRCCFWPISVCFQMQFGWHSVYRAQSKVSLRWMRLLRG